jgi:hypothetical protein
MNQRRYTRLGRIKGSFSSSPAARAAVRHITQRVDGTWNCVESTHCARTSAAPPAQGSAVRAQGSRHPRPAAHRHEVARELRKT